MSHARLAVCHAPCQYYAAAGNWGLGECRAPGCGCTGVKAALATSFCPFPGGSRWPDQLGYQPPPRRAIISPVVPAPTRQT